MDDISNFNELFSYILGIIFVIIVFSLGYAYLKPHRLHKKHPISTLLLKISYLFYLLALLIIVYLSTLVKEGLDAVFQDIEFFAFLLVLFVPTIGIFARKLGYFRKQRESFYYFFSIINLLSVVAMILMYNF